MNISAKKLMYLLSKPSLSDGDIIKVRNLVTALQDSDDGLDFRGENSMTPLMMACLKGHTEAVEAILATGVNINEEDEGTGYTALDYAYQSRNEDVINLMAKANERVITLEEKYLGAPNSELQSKTFTFSTSFFGGEVDEVDEVEALLGDLSCRDAASFI